MSMASSPTGSRSRTPAPCRSISKTGASPTIHWLPASGASPQWSSRAAGESWSLPPAKTAATRPNSSIPISPSNPTVDTLPSCGRTEVSARANGTPTRHSAKTSASASLRMSSANHSSTPAWEAPSCRPPVRHRLRPGTNRDSSRTHRGIPPLSRQASASTPLPPPRHHPISLVQASPCRAPHRQRSMQTSPTMVSSITSPTPPPPTPPRSGTSISAAVPWSALSPCGTAATTAAAAACATSPSRCSTTPSIQSSPRHSSIPKTQALSTRQAQPRSR